MSKHYVVAVYSDEEPGDVKIVGPFQDSDRAGRWGRKWQRTNGDNPCWNTVTLPDGVTSVKITAP